MFNKKQIVKMSNVSMTLAPDAEYQNLVVKGQSTFEFGAFNKLTAGFVDAESVTIETLRVNTLNQSNSAGNPFAGVVLAPNELVALTATKALTTYPYSQSATDETVIQRSATNSVNANFLAGSGTSNQLVLGTGTTTSINAVQNAFLGGLGIGGSVAAVQWLLSGSTSVVNSRSGLNLLSINEDAGGAAMQISIVLDIGDSNQVTSLEYRINDVSKWSLTMVTVLGLPQLELRQGGPGGVTNVVFQMTDVASSTTQVEGNIRPTTTNTFDLGDSTHRFGQLYLMNQSVTQLTNINTAVTFSTSTGLGTTVANPGVAPQTAQAFGLTDTQYLLGVSPFLIACTATGFTASGTTPIPIFQFDNSSSEIYIINGTTAAQTLSNSATFSFVILNANGSGP